MQKKYKILLVEDEESLRIIYSDYLTQEGFEVIEASDGQIALEKAYSIDDVDLVLLDVMLPKIDGLEVLSQLRINPKTKHLKVYLMTVLGRDSTVKKAFELGADGYLVKDTLNPEQIKQEILSVLEPNKD